MLLLKDAGTKPQPWKDTTVPAPAGEKEVGPEASQCASFNCECDS